jgi:protein gp37
VPRLKATRGTVYSGRKFTDVACHPERLEDPLRWSRPRGIFVNSLSDLFHEDVPERFIDQVFAVMALAQQHVFMILTKRAKRMRDYMQAFSWERVVESCTREDGSSAIPRHTMQALRHHFAMMPDHPMRSTPRRDLWSLPNVWLLVSVEDQKAADERIPYLLETPAVVRGVSAELVGQTGNARSAGDSSRRMGRADTAVPVRICCPERTSRITLTVRPGRIASPLTGLSLVARAGHVSGCVRLILNGLARSRRSAPRRA